MTPPEEEQKPISVDKYAIIILAIAAISCTGVLATYFSIFNGPLSTSTSKWESLVISLAGH
jgi:hypothetical protein